ncbi:hypothetical protein Ancab_022993, partial [Ancistrocladus abbreviatus]
AKAMFKKAKSKVKPNANTFNILFFGWCRVRNLARGMRLLEEMVDSGFQLDNFTYNTAIDIFCKAGMIKEAADIFEFMKRQGSTLSSPTAKTYSIMILALVKNDRIDECFRVVDDMVKSGCLPDVSTYKELIEGCTWLGEWRRLMDFYKRWERKAILQIL